MVPVITIDGPSGSGKGTLAFLLAQHLGWNILDSGSLYRLLALRVVQARVDLGVLKELLQVADKLEVAFTLSENGLQVQSNGLCVTEALRQEAIGMQAARIAEIPEIRAFLYHYQRGFMKSPGLIADGRDMGTVVFPEALVKIFLHASAEVRAQRRCSQLQKTKNGVSIERVFLDVEKRDRRDENRKVAPLIPADDAFHIDSTFLSIEEVFARVKTLLSSKGLLFAE